MQIAKQILLIASGGIAGAGIQGGITEWLAGRDGGIIAIYALLTLVGLLLGALCTW